jgi:hypothetical protein
MYKFIRIQRFAKQLFDDDKTAKQASEIMEAILEAQSPRISDIADKMKGGEAGNYKKVQRFLKATDTHTALKRLMNAEAEFVIGDPTEIERIAAKNTDYVGYLGDGETRGFWMLPLSTPMRGRAIPCNLVIYSSATIGSQSTSRNLEHVRVIREIREAIGERALLLDREFSYLDLFQSFEAAGMNFVIRLNMGSKPKFYYDADKEQELSLWIIQDGKPKIYRDIYYKGSVKVNVIGIWEPGMKEPLWVITNLEPEEALRLYRERMKIETSFRDMKSIFNLNKIMNKSLLYLKRMISLLLIAYAISALVGEAIRDVRFAGVRPDEVDLLTIPKTIADTRWYSFSGVFLLLRRRRRLSFATLAKIVSRVFSIFSALLFGDYVRTPVRT